MKAKGSKFRLKRFTVPHNTTLFKRSRNIFLMQSFTFYRTYFNIVLLRHFIDSHLQKSYSIVDVEVLTINYCYNNWHHDILLSSQSYSESFYIRRGLPKKIVFFHATLLISSKISIIYVWAIIEYLINFFMVNLCINGF